MNNEKQFLSENFLIAVVLHLGLVALIITSFYVIVDRAKLVAPDRIQITEIDLTQVKITRDETKLYNTEQPPQLDQIEFPKSDNKKTPEPEIGDDKPIETPTMADQKPEKKKDEKSKEDKKPETPKPKKKTVVRVNRETANLDRTMTVSVIDALRVALTRCWVIDGSRDGLADIRAVAHLTMYKNGTIRDVWFESAARADNDPAFAYVLETIRGALTTCQPFKMLPASEFDHWEKIQLTFYPTQGKIM